MIGEVFLMMSIKKAAFFFKRKARTHTNQKWNRSVFLYLCGWMILSFASTISMKIIRDYFIIIFQICWLRYCSWSRNSNTEVWWSWCWARKSTKGCTCINKTKANIYRSWTNRPHSKWNYRQCWKVSSYFLVCANIFELLSINLSRASRDENICMLSLC